MSYKPVVYRKHNARQHLGFFVEWLSTVDDRQRVQQFLERYAKEPWNFDTEAGYGRDIAEQRKQKLKRRLAAKTA